MPVVALVVEPLPHRPRANALFAADQPTIILDADVELSEDVADNKFWNQFILRDDDRAQ